MMTALLAMLSPRYCNDAMYQVTMANVMAMRCRLLPVPSRCRCHTPLTIYADDIFEIRADELSHQRSGFIA